MGAVADLADHVEHESDVAGSDFDGIGLAVADLEDVSKFLNLLEAFASRGWRDGDLRKLPGEKLLHLLDSATAAFAPNR